MRIDKYLKIARLIKRRTIAKEACEQGKVSINGKVAKAGDDVKIGDKVSIAFGSGAIDIEVLEVKDHASKEMANEMYKNI
jgi:ribosomal 50S subunit-recycling heat shock protein